MECDSTSEEAVIVVGVDWCETDGTLFADEEEEPGDHSNILVSLGSLH